MFKVISKSRADNLPSKADGVPNVHVQVHVQDFLQDVVSPQQIDRVLIVWQSGFVLWRYDIIGEVGNSTKFSHNFIIEVL